MPSTLLIRILGGGLVGFGFARASVAEHAHVWFRFSISTDLHRCQACTERADKGTRSSSAACRSSSTFSTYFCNLEKRTFALGELLLSLIRLGRIVS